jgi:hypothetical protein
MVALGSRLRERETKAVPRREGPRIESALVSGDGMGHCILVRPGYFRARLHRESRWAEGKVHHSDAVSSIGRPCRRGVGGRCRGRTATSSQEHEETCSQQAQPDFCGEKRISFLHVSSSSAMLRDQHMSEVSLSIWRYLAGLHDQVSCGGRTLDL